MPQAASSFSDPALPLLRGKRILVTGAASGIGRGAVDVFVQAGARVVATDRDADLLAEAWGGHAHVSVKPLDVIDEAQCEDAVAFAVDRLGGLDGVLNSAGISDIVSPATEIAIEDWQRIVDVNLRGSFLVARTAARHMLAAGGGSIVLISSVNGIAGIPRRHAYGPAKAAIAQLTRTLACEWGGAALRVNALAPTYINTPMIVRLAAEGKVDLDRLRRRTPMGRLGEVEDIAQAACFLLSDQSRYITGAILPVDGGWLAYGGPGDVVTA
ncbi:MAG: SDR family NAD(P)-dependent oxidoreductase [Sphingobium sp.]|uniref:SDR family NAD(P)-dependent oxidoreductase n=1 Tax=Sphingobium sp. TaxID=1912891 RepID=UPI002E1B4BD2